MSSGGIGLNQPENASLIHRMRAEAVVKGAASWFLMIAGLSIVNSIISAAGGGWRFIFGLGITQVVDAIAHNAGGTGVVLDLIINAFVAGIFVLFWNFARAGEKWAFIVGMAVYVLDGVLCLLFKDIFAGAFHAWALFRIYQGFSSISLLDSLRQGEIATGNTPIQPR
jgi:hypothetical protein